MISLDKIFVSDCGEYIAIRIPGLQPAFDVWKHDGSEFWEGTRYVELPNKPKCYNPRSMYTEEFARPTKGVGSWINCGHRTRNGEWYEAFELVLYDLVTNESMKVKFHTGVATMLPNFRYRRGCVEVD
jgi:hypothetical protein